MLKLKVNDKENFKLERDGTDWLIDGKVEDVDMQHLPDGSISIIYNGKSHVARVESVDKDGKIVVVNIKGQKFTVAVTRPIDELLRSMGMDNLTTKKAEAIFAPMPGLILKIMVETGQAIEKGDPLLILEAMKMENVIKATGPAIVKNIKAVEKTAVEKGSVLIELA